MAWRRPGDNPLSEPMMVILPPHICVTRPQWVKILSANGNHSVHVSMCWKSSPIHQFVNRHQPPLTLNRWGLGLYSSVQMWINRSYRILFYHGNTDINIWMIICTNCSFSQLGLNCFFDPVRVYTTTPTPCWHLIGECDSKSVYNKSKLNRTNGI